MLLFYRKEGLAFLSLGVPRITGSILALNAGSSSLKFALFAPDGDETMRGQVQGIGAAAHAEATRSDGRALDAPSLAGSTHDDVLPALLAWLHEHAGGDRIEAVGHRIVHGGQRFADPVRIDDRVLAELDALVPLAPLHQPHSLAAIRAIGRAEPGIVQVGCFDTAFHRTMPDVAKRLALPRHLAQAGLCRYGFHGLSYEFVAGRLRTLSAGLAAGRVIVAHLGSGASLCALQNGRSVETTMGFSVLDGLVMGTRPGNLDAGAVLYLMQTLDMSAGDIEDLLYHKSGLLGVSDVSADMRKLAASTSTAAQEAIDLFCYRIAGEAGRLAAALGGLDGFVFTAGIGEHDAPLRAQICTRLAWLGLELEPAANIAGKGRTSPERRWPEVWVVPTDEEAVIARHTRARL